MIRRCWEHDYEDCRMDCHFRCVHSSSILTKVFMFVVTEEYYVLLFVTFHKAYSSTKKTSYPPNFHSNVSMDSWIFSLLTYHQIIEIKYIYCSYSNHNNSDITSNSKIWVIIAVGHISRSSSNKNTKTLINILFKNTFTYTWIYLYLNIPTNLHDNTPKNIPKNKK